jgi:hypothetical protein
MGAVDFNATFNNIIQLYRGVQFYLLEENRVLSIPSSNIYFICSIDITYLFLIQNQVMKETGTTFSQTTKCQVTMTYFKLPHQS